MKVIIDRFEGKYAICEKENKEMIDIETDKIPTGAKEGDVLIIANDKIVVDKESTIERKDNIQDLFNNLKK